MFNAFDGKQDSPCGLDDETPTAAAEMEGRARSAIASALALNESISIYTQLTQRPKFHDKKAIQAGKKKEPLTFMDLPSEVRNIIYEKALTRPDGKFIIRTKHSTKLCRRRAVLDKWVAPLNRPFGNLYGYFDTRSYLGYLGYGDLGYLGMYGPPPENPDQRVASTPNLALLRTSKAVHAEAGAIIYGQKLIFPDLMTLQSFLTGLKPSQISLLRHVVLDADPQPRMFPMFPTTNRFQHQTDTRPFMPSVFALIAGADSLDHLDPDIRHIDLWASMLRNSIRPHTTMSITGLDVIVAHAMAAEVYSRLFTYLRRAVAVRGIEKVMEVLDVFDSVFRYGPDCMMAELEITIAPSAPWTEERKAGMKRAMVRKIVRLLKRDNN